MPGSKGREALAPKMEVCWGRVDGELGSLVTRVSSVVVSTEDSPLCKTGSLSGWISPRPLSSAHMVCVPTLLTSGWRGLQVAVKQQRHPEYRWRRVG